MVREHVTDTRLTEPIGRRRIDKVDAEIEYSEEKVFGILIARDGKIAIFCLLIATHFDAAESDRRYRDSGPSKRSGQHGDA